MTPDYSMFPQMDEYGIFKATYENRYLGALWYSMGILVILTIGWTTPKYYSLCFLGVEKGSVVAISTMGVQQDDITQKLFLDGYHEMQQRLQPSLVICLGSCLKEIVEENVLYISYDQSFGNQFQVGWQEPLFLPNGKGGYEYGF